MPNVRTPNGHAKSAGQYHRRGGDAGKGWGGAEAVEDGARCGSYRRRGGVRFQATSRVRRAARGQRASRGEKSLDGWIEGPLTAEDAEGAEGLFLRALCVLCG